ncbi:hypothetical protein [Sedimentibacter sp.]|uniref:hypothetical protein n=1 Tax=Sedimentibacter sp. TaxID=1960295 RepID=UPI000EE902FC|nr:hypothetical protein [Sedimentibacter sp.]HCX63178.1 hypothetical protein [Clostridiales bacterium]
MYEERKYLEVNLPPYLQEDIAKLEEGRSLNLVLRLDALYNEVQGSINSALHSGRITEEQALYLRKKYLC